MSSFVFIKEQKSILGLILVFAIRQLLLPHLNPYSHFTVSIECNTALRVMNCFPLQLLSYRRNVKNYCYFRCKRSNETHSLFPPVQTFSPRTQAVHVHFLNLSSFASSSIGKEEVSVVKHSHEDDLRVNRCLSYIPS